MIHFNNRIPSADVLDPADLQEVDPESRPGITQSNRNTLLGYAERRNDSKWRKAVQDAYEHFSAFIEDEEGIIPDLAYAELSDFLKTTERYNHLITLTCGDKLSHGRLYDLDVLKAITEEVRDEEINEAVADFWREYTAIANIELTPEVQSLLQAYGMALAKS